MDKGIRKDKLMLIASMTIFGTIGIFRKYIPFPSSVVALVRGVIGSVFLLSFVLFGKKKLSGNSIGKKLPLLCLSGAMIGFNWILLFEAYRYTSVATATLSYYMAPIFVTLASPFLLKEKLTARKGICVIAALIGMVLVSGVINTGISDISEFKGILFGLGAALLYASVILMNKRLSDVDSYDRTVFQLASAAIVLLPYTLLTENFAAIEVSALAIVLLIVVGIIHTGFAYYMYFGSMKNLKAQTVALYSYIDPVVAIILSAVLLRENMDVFSIIGAVLILFSTLISDLPEKKHN